MHLTQPAHSGAIFLNYKKTFSIVLLAVVDADYRFLYVDVGTNGRVSDGGVFNNSSFGRALEGETLSLPRPAPLPGTNTDFPYFFVADDAFSLKPHLLKPFPFRNMSRNQRIYNYRLSRARRIVENVFGIFSQRFRCLRSAMNLSPDTAEVIVLAACALHNMLRSRGHSSAGDMDQEDPHTHLIQPGAWRSSANAVPLANIAAQVGSATRYAQTAKAVREALCDYVNSVGAVPWQDDMIF